MRSVWSREPGSGYGDAVGEAFGQLRSRLPAGTTVSAVLVILLVLAIANSTVAAQWVPGSDVLTQVAVLAALVMGLLAVIRVVPWPLALALGLAAAPAAAYLVTSPFLNAAHPADPHGFGLARVWWARLVTGDAAADPIFYLYLLALLFWVVGGWLSWCVLRWRQPLLGLVPGAAAFATNVLNYPTDQNGYTLAFLVLTLALLLWTTYHRQLTSAARTHLKLSSDARWDFWEAGVVVTAALVALGIFLPPLTTTDRSVDIENGAFRNWADLQARLNHPVVFGRGPGDGSSVGFNPDVPLGGSLHKTGAVVFTYALEGQFSGPRYFRGVDEVRTAGAEWRYVPDGNHYFVRKDDIPGYQETYLDQATSSVDITMLRPPRNNADLIFAPGALYRISRDVVLLQSVPSGPGEPLLTADRISSLRPNSGAGQYRVVVTNSTATEPELQAAGTDYPAWLRPYRSFNQPGQTGSYRSPQTMARIRRLAQEVTAGATNPYDMASLIEAYLRTQYSFTLTPPESPTGVDRLEYFLFTSKEGYCEYFATAMGDMLRSLGIPTRLVTGYGGGTYDDKVGKFVVKESDSHTWVEAYFPHYGWIPFEPTNDGTYLPIPRGSLGRPICTRDVEACDAAGAGDTSDAPDSANPKKPDKGDVVQGDFGPISFGRGGLLAPGALAVMAAFLLLLAAATYLIVSRYLRPKTAGGVWKRTALLARLAGVRKQPGDTPHEFGRRLAREFPEAAGPARELAAGFAVAAYAPPPVARRSRDHVLEVWEALRPLLLQRVRQRLRPA